MNTEPEPTLHPLPPDGPAPVPSLLTQPFWDGCARGELLFQRCDSCRAANFEPTPGCRACGSQALTWEASGGRGTLYSWTVIWRPQSPEFTVPYACGIVTLEEGYRMLATVAGCNPSDLVDALPLEVDFAPAASGRLLPFFRPPREAGARS